MTDSIEQNKTQQVIGNQLSVDQYPSVKLDIINNMAQSDMSLSNIKEEEKLEASEEASDNKNPESSKLDHSKSEQTILKKQQTAYDVQQNMMAQLQTDQSPQIQNEVKTDEQDKTKDIMSLIVKGIIKLKKNISQEGQKSKMIQDDINSKNSEYLKQLEESKNQMLITSKKLEDSALENSSLVDEVTELKKQLQLSNSDQKQKQEEYVKSVQVLLNKLIQSEEIAAINQSNIHTLNVDLKKRQEQTEHQTTVVDQLQISISKLKEQLSMKDNQILELQNQNLQAQQVYTDFQNEQQKKQSEFQKQLNDHKRIIDDLSMKLNQSTESEKHLKAQLDKITNDLSVKTQNNQDQLEKTTNLNAELITIKQTLQQTQMNLQQKIDVEQNQIKQIEVLNNQITQLNEKVNQQKQSMAEKELDLQKSQQKISDLDRRVQEQDNLIVTKDSEIKDIQKKKEDLTIQCQQYEKSSLPSQDIIKQQQSQIDNLQLDSQAKLNHSKQLTEQNDEYVSKMAKSNQQKMYIFVASTLVAMFAIALEVARK